MLSLDTILDAIEGPYEVHGERDVTIGAIRYDSRTVLPGDLFVAINGPDDRGVEFTGQAVSAGARVVVTDAAERMPHELFEGNGVTLIVVRDARLAMAHMAHAAAGYPARRLKLIGVTGTNGKTTVTYVLRQLLEACGEQVGVIGTLGKFIGNIVPTGYTTPEAPELAAILAEMADAGLTTVAMEVSSHALALHRVAGLEFAGAAFTNLTQDHLDFHATMEDYREAKKRLFDELPGGRPAAVNVDDPHCGVLVRDTSATVLGFGRSAEADARIGNIRLLTEGSRWQLDLSETLGGGVVDLATPLLGAFNVWNVTAAATLAIGLGFERERVFDTVARLEPVPGRMQSIRLGNGATAVIDYAHTPDALENVLESLRELRGDGRIVVVFGCGGDRDRGKRPIMGAVAAAGADRVILTSDNPRNEDPEAIIDEIERGLPSDASYERIADRRAAIVHALEAAGPTDLVLVAGKGHEDYQIIGTERRHFSDTEVVHQWCAEHTSPGGATEATRG